MKHTPAPWYYGLEGKDAYHIVEKDGTNIVHLVTLSNSTASSNMEANVRLMTTSPELLDVLKDLLYDLDTVDSHYLNETVLPIREDIARAKAIVAKAEGA
jgi:hypothetical protein